MKVKMCVFVREHSSTREDMPDLAGVTRHHRSSSPVEFPLNRCAKRSRHQQTEMGCNSSNQVGSDPPNANLPSKQPQTEEEMAEAAKEAAAKAKLNKALNEAGDDLEKIEAMVAAAKKALEAALEEANEDQDKVMWLADYYSRCDLSRHEGAQVC